jgi:hypothetical protein
MRTVGQRTGDKGLAIKHRLAKFLRSLPKFSHAYASKTFTKEPVREPKIHQISHGRESGQASSLYFKIDSSGHESTADGSVTEAADRTTRCWSSYCIHTINTANSPLAA